MRNPWLRVLVVAAFLGILAGGLWITPVDGDDAYHHSVLAVEQAKCWRHGVIWPRFHPDWNGGTGSFLPSVYSPLVLTLDAGLLLITGEASRAISLSLALALLVVFLLMGRHGKGSSGQWWMLAIAPYLLLDVLARATVTEMWALAVVAGILPVLLPHRVTSRRQGLVLVVLLAFAVGCQTIMLILVAVPLAVTWSVSWILDHQRAWKWTLGWSVAGALLSGIFWLPPLLLIGNFDRATIFGGAYGWRGHFATSLSGNAELGPALLATWTVLVMTVVAATIELRRSMNVELRAILVFSAVCLFLASPMSLPLWHLPGLGLVQFPWRFLGPASLAVALLLMHVGRRTRNVLGAAFLVAIVLVPVELTRPVPLLTPGLSRHGLEEACAIRYGLAPILPMTPGESARGFKPLQSLGRLWAQKSTVTQRSGGCRFPQVFDVAADGKEPVLLPLQWWPELGVWMGDRTLEYENLDGLVGVRLAAGQHRITVSLQPSSSRRIGAVISLAGLFLVGILWIVWGKRGEGGRGDAPGDAGPESPRRD